MVPSTVVGHLLSAGPPATTNEEDMMHWLLLLSLLAAGCATARPSPSAALECPPGKRLTFDVVQADRQPVGNVLALGVVRVSCD